MNTNKSPLPDITRAAPGRATSVFPQRLLAALCCVVALPIPLNVSAAVVSNQFVEAKDSAGRPVIDDPGETYGTAWGDWNGDGAPDVWLGKHQYTPTGFYRNNGDGTFTNVIDSAVVDATAHYGDDTHGVAWADFDNDGDDDLMEVSGGGAGEASGSPTITDEWRNNLFVNTGGLLIEDAEGYGVDYPRGRSRTPLWVDFNNDGALDFVDAVFRSTTEQYASAIFQQNATGFADVSLSTGFDAGSCHSAMLSHLGSLAAPALICVDTSRVTRIYDISATPFVDLRPVVGNAIFNAFLFDLAIGDFNGDLLPDVFGGTVPPNPSAAVRTGPANDRIHSFIASSTTERGFSFTAPGDVQLEFGWETARADVFLGANGVAPPTNSDVGWRGPNLYPHRIRMTLSAANASYTGMVANRTAGIYIGRVGGEWQVRVINAGGEVNLIALASGISAPTAIGGISLNQGGASAPALFLNQAGALVVSPTATAFLDSATAIQTYARSVVTGDFDNDMDLDVYVGASGKVANVPNLLFDNQGNGTFRLVANGGGAAGSLLGRTDTVALVDYDQNGFLDLFVTQGKFPAPFSYVGEQQLFRNQGNSNHWALIDLEGVASNRDGVGAIIYATTPDGKVQMREQSNGVHRYVQDYVQTHFGLAGNTQVDVDVFWPSGTIDHFTGLPANQVHRLVEGSSLNNNAPTCGAPVYSRASETGVFIWNDCGSNRWHVRATAGGATVSYQGSLTANPALTDLIGFSIEASDRLPSPTYLLNVSGTTQDGFDFSVAAGGQACFSLTSPSNVPVLAGANRVAVGSSVTLPDFLPCSANPVVVDVADLDLNEGDGQAQFTITLSPAPAVGEQIAIDYQTTDGTATADSDYTATSGTLTFSAGETTKSVLVPIVDDTDPEEDEHFSLVLTSTETNAATATATIHDNDTVIAPPACGAPTPAYNKATETAVFLWNDCGTSQWHVRATAGGQAVSFQGSLTATPAFANLTGFSFERTDRLPPNFVMNVSGTAQDGIDFSLPGGGQGCFSLTSPSGATIVAGANRSLITGPVALPGFGPCTP
jgi:hypothetical protein